MKCEKKENHWFRKSSMFTWISLILDKNEYNWNDIDSDGHDFLYYCCDEIKEKIIKKYPIQYENYLKNIQTNKFKI